MGKLIIITITSIILGIIAFFSIVGLLYKPTIKIPETFVGTHVEIDGLKIRYYQIGKGDDIILVHGGLGSIETFLPLAEILSKKYRITIFDRPGCGFSEVNEYTYSLKGNAQIIKGLIDTLGIKKPLIVGHSHGSAVTMAFNNYYPNIAKGYLLLGLCAFPYEEIAYAKTPIEEKIIGNTAMIPVFGKGFAKIFLMAIGKDMYKDAFVKIFYPGNMPDGYMDNASPWITDPRTMITLFRNAWDFDKDIRPFYKNYPNIKTKLTIINGEKDFYIETPPGAKRLNKEVVGSKLIILPETGHMVYYENRDVVIEEITKLMK